MRGLAVFSLRHFGETKHEHAIYHISLLVLGIITGLRSKAFWSADDFDLPWVTDFENGFLDVREELLALRGRGGFQVE